MTRRLATRSRWPAWLRYGVVGLLTNLLAYLLYLALLRIGWPYAGAMTASYASGIVMGFVMHRRFTFEHRGPVATSAVRFGVAYLAGYLLNLAGLRWLVDGLQVDPRIAQALMVLVVAGLLFLLQRAWVFRAGPGRPASGGEAPTGHAAGRAPGEGVR